MSNEPLLLLPGREAEPRAAYWLRVVSIAAGVFVVVVGLADVTSRAATAVFGERALFNAFAPPAALDSSLAPAATASSSEALTPARLQVPALGIDAKVEEVGKKADGSMGTPKDFMQVGFYSPGPKPGQAGHAAFVGHVNNALTKGGIFEHLDKVQKGDYVTVSNAEGKTLVYEVSEIRTYKAGEAPLSSIFRTTGPSRLVLITCSGEWIPAERQYEDRLVVVAELAY